MRIFYLAQCIDNPSGGTKVMYQHVDLLNEMGYDAAIWHDTEGFRYRFFPNETRIVYGANGAKPDLIVTAPTPTDLGDDPKIVFDQNPYYMGENGSRRIDAFMVVSEDSRRYIGMLHPGKKIGVVPNFIDPKIFPLCIEKLKVVTMDGRKNWEDMEQVIRLIKPYCDSNGWRLVAFNDMAEPEVSETLQKAAIHLQFGLREGLCLMPMEAMSCGCRVIGYHGQGGIEYVDPDIWDTISAGNIVRFAETVVERMEQFDEDQDIGFSGHQFIHGKYSREKTKKALKEMIESVCG